MNELKKEQIALEVIKVLKSRFDSFPNDLAESRNAPFHKAFLGAFADKLQGKVFSIPFFISLSSWAHGLSTTLGQNFFENVAHILCDGEKKEFNTRRNATLKIAATQRETVAVLVNQLSNGKRAPNLQEENELLFAKIEGEQFDDATDFTVDVFFEDETQVVCIELKTVKPNKGVFKVEKQKILEAKAVLKNKFPNKKIEFYLAFPFDPTSSAPTDYDKDRFMRYAIDFRKYIAKDEVLLAAEFWDFLSGETETMKGILDIINSIATVNFLDEFAFLQDRSNLKNAPQKYIETLEKWRLKREKLLAENDSQIQAELQSLTSLQRVYNQSVFKDSGKHNESRLLQLLDLIQ